MKFYVILPFSFLMLAFIAPAEDAVQTDRVDQLKEQWQQALERVRKPVDAKYRTELKTLINLYTKSGNLELANKAQRNLELLDQNIGGFSFTGKWRATVDSTGWNEMRSVSDTHVVTADGNMHTYKVQGSYVRIDFGGGNWDRLKIDPKNLNVLRGENTAGYKLTYSRVSE